MQNTFDRVYTATCGYFAPTMASLTLTIVLISLLDIVAIVSITCINRKLGHSPAVQPANDSKLDMPSSDRAVYANPYNTSGYPVTPA